MPKSKPKLIIALDYPTANEALKLATACQHLNPKPWLKIGLQLYVAAGPDLVKELKKLGFNIFLDLKFYDIPNTVASAITSAINLDVDIIDIHISGGEKMARAAVKALANANDKQKRPLLFGVTVLTSEANTQTQEIIKLAQKAKDWGLDGVVCSALEVKELKQTCGNDFLCLTPGIRLSDSKNKGNENQDQARVMTPEEAIKAGSDFLVVGRPITQAENPLQVIEQILKILSSN